jgi:hypothetical protein
MIVGNVFLKAEVVELLRRYRLGPHHRLALLANQKENGITPPPASKPD